MLARRRERRRQTIGEHDAERGGGARYVRIPAIVITRSDVNVISDSGPYMITGRSEATVE